MHGHSTGKIMIILGVILLTAGFVLAIKILWAIGIIALVIGLVLLVAGSMDTHSAAADTTSKPTAKYPRPHRRPSNVEQAADRSETTLERITALLDTDDQEPDRSGVPRTPFHISAAGTMKLLQPPKHGHPRAAHPTTKEQHLDNEEAECQRGAV
jgi:hypothetical protein